jgi:hypothetical protein
LRQRQRRANRVEGARQSRAALSRRSAEGRGRRGTWRWGELATAPTRRESSRRRTPVACGAESTIRGRTPKTQNMGSPDSEKVFIADRALSVCDANPTTLEISRLRHLECRLSLVPLRSIWRPVGRPLRRDRRGGRRANRDPRIAAHRPIVRLSAVPRTHFFRSLPALLRVSREDTPLKACPLCGYEPS